MLGAVSRAFVKEDTEAAPLVRPRAPLPEGARNYVTPRGLGLLRAEREALIQELAASEQSERETTSSAAELRGRLADIDARIACAELIDPTEGPSGVVRFGARVTVGGADGVERTYRIVGVDEADAASGRVAFVAPLARALIGKRVGDVAVLKTPRSEEELEVLAIDFAPDRDDVR